MKSMKGMSGLRITFLLPGRGTSGGVRSTVRMGNGLLSRGHDVRILYRKGSSGCYERIRELYLKLRYGFSTDWLSMFRGDYSCYNELRPDDFLSDELIISMCTQTAWDMWSLPYEVGKKVLYCRGAEPHKWNEMLETWRLPIYKLVISSRLKEMIQRETNQQVVGIVRNGVNPREYYASLSDSDRNGIGSIFGWGPAKNPDGVIKIMQMLNQRLPYAPQYSFSNGKKVKGIKVTQFKRMPTVEAARKIYSCCKVWFLASNSEGCPSPLLEAISCGCAVVSTDCGGANDIIENGVNGFLVDVGDIDAMVNRIELLYKDDALRKRICANACKRVQEFSWEKSVEKLEGYLLSIYHEEMSHLLLKND